MTETILLTDATDYVTSHTRAELLDAGYQVIGLDNLCNSSLTMFSRVEQITAKTPKFAQGDARDRRLLDDLFASSRISAVTHFAAFKSVGESVQKPLAYYDNNMGGLMTLCAAMTYANVRQLMFNSSITVYGNPHTVPITESLPFPVTNPCGQTKVMGEQVLRDLKISNAVWQVAYLRYFSPVDAHHDGLIGGDPCGIPNNLMSYVAQITVDKRKKLSIYGGDRPTPDSTDVRDYTHAVGFARGHLSALDALRRDGRGLTVNLGTGRGYSALEVVEAYKHASDKSVSYQIVGRRPDDIAACYVDSALVASLLKWRAQYDIERMCEDSWRWQSTDPDGSQTRG